MITRAEKDIVMSSPFPKLLSLDIGIWYFPHIDKEEWIYLSARWSDTLVSTGVRFSTFRRVLGTRKKSSLPPLSPCWAPIWFTLWYYEDRIMLRLFCVVKGAAKDVYRKYELINCIRCGLHVLWENLNLQMGNLSLGLHIDIEMVMRMMWWRNIIFCSSDFPFSRFNEGVCCIVAKPFYLYPMQSRCYSLECGSVPKAKGTHR